MNETRGNHHANLLSNLRKTWVIAVKSQTNIELTPGEMGYLIQCVDNAETRLCLLQARINKIVGILEGIEDDA